MDFYPVLHFFIYPSHWGSRDICAIGWFLLPLHPYILPQLLLSCDRQMGVDSD